jgi:RNA-binding protein Luc7-like 2
MAVKLFRKQLDELMGVNRNGDRINLIIKGYDDKRVCKYELAGLCPYKLFPNTKQDLGKCPYECCPVPEKFKKEYDHDKATKNIDLGYERELETFIEKLVTECDDRIARAQRRLEAQQKNALTNEPIELKNVRAEMETVTRQVEELTNNEQFEEAQTLMERLEALKKEKEGIEQKMPQTKEQQLIVCETCAALLSVNESDQRLADHFAGKMHLGFQKIRDKLKELKDMRIFEDRRTRDTDREKKDRGGKVDVPLARERDPMLWMNSNAGGHPEDLDRSRRDRNEYRGSDPSRGDPSRGDPSRGDRPRRDYSDRDRRRDDERRHSSSRHGESRHRKDERDGRHSSRDSRHGRDHGKRRRERSESEDDRDRSPSPYRKFHRGDSPHK